MVNVFAGPMRVRTDFPFGALGIPLAEAQPRIGLAIFLSRALRRAARIFDALLGGLVLADRVGGPRAGAQAPSGQSAALSRTASVTAPCGLSAAPKKTTPEAGTPGAVVLAFIPLRNSSMTIVPQAPVGVDVVSYSLLLTHAARRIAKKIHLDPAPLESVARREYRATDNHFAAIRAIREEADAMRKSGGGLRA